MTGTGIDRPIQDGCPTQSDHMWQLRAKTRYLTNLYDAFFDFFFVVVFSDQLLVAALNLNCSIKATVSQFNTILRYK